MSDPSRKVATPLAVIDARATLADATPLRAVLADYDDVGELVVGLPLSMDGSEGPQAARVRVAAERIGEMAGLPVVFADERLSSTEAARRMSETGASSKSRRGSVDKVAAAVFLQAYLDATGDD